MEQSWPGNVRELENAMRRLAALARDELITAGVAELWITHGESGGDMRLQAAEPGQLSGDMSLEALIGQWLQRHVAQAPSPPEEGLYDRLLAEFERPLLETAMLLTHGNQLKAARLLGVNRNTLRKMLNERGVEPATGRR